MAQLNHFICLTIRCMDTYVAWTLVTSLKMMYLGVLGTIVQVFSLAPATSERARGSLAGGVRFSRPSEIAKKVSGDCNMSFTVPSESIHTP